MRVKVPFPEPAAFVHDLEVRVGDLNYGRHLGHDALVSLLHEARVRFLAARGASELDTDGLGMVVADLAVRYRAEAFLGDHLRVEVACGERSAKSCDLHYRVTNLSSGRLVAEAKTGVVFVDRDGCVAKLPRVMSDE